MRVSTVNQTTDLQEDALLAAGCERIFCDTISGSTTSRPGLDQCLDFLRSGDTLLTWKIDRIGRSLPHLLTILNGLHSRGIHFVSLTEQIDTRTPAGKMIFSVLGALSEYERSIIQQRVRSGLESARLRGRIGGRKKVVTESKAAAIKAMREQNLTPNEICKALEISRATYFRHRV
jgi:DNA invertase Pin-like site-specific DNA recombinase